MLKCSQCWLQVQTYDQTCVQLVQLAADLSTVTYWQKLFVALQTPISTIFGYGKKAGVKFLFCQWVFIQPLTFLFSTIIIILSGEIKVLFSSLLTEIDFGTLKHNKTFLNDYIQEKWNAYTSISASHTLLIGVGRRQTATFEYPLDLNLLISRLMDSTRFKYSRWPRAAFSGPERVEDYRTSGWSWPRVQAEGTGIPNSFSWILKVWILIQSMLCILIIHATFFNWHLISLYFFAAF